MLALRYAALLALVVWAGGLIALGSVAAPAAFDVLAARQVGEGRLIAGAIFGETLRRFHQLAYLCGGVLLLSLIARRVLGPRPRRAGIRVALASIMLASTMYSGLVVAGRIQTLQREIGGAPSTLPASDARRAEFGRLHATSTILLLVPILGSLALIWWELKD
jgi:Domain of unknown function (DUF4149)